ncbi:MAG: B12-binding domain-containing radical SAM protein [Deltaproteobacteria bacterium]|nr:B12-binding domain-containing radical SAM protein [Deltaproteobacteria bacterium]
MAKILLINPVIREEDVPKHVPYGLALLAAIVEKEGHLVQVFDANAWRLGDDAMVKVCQADNWDVIGIGGLTTTYNSIKKYLHIIKSTCPNSFIIAGGGFITSMPREIMRWNPEINLGILGEAFITLPEVLNKIDKRDFDFSSTKGVCFRNAAGDPQITAVRENIPDLDALPYPAWDYFPMDIYFKNSSSLYSETAYTSKRRMDINGSLGCNLICRFCWHLGTTGDMVVEQDENGNNDVRFSYGRNIRYHSPRYLVDLVKFLKKKYNIDFVNFLDENLMTMDLFSRRTWLQELCTLWISEGLQPSCKQKNIPHDENCRGIHWAGTSHAGLAKKETLQLMSQAGCSHLIYGIESFDPGILKSMGKATTQRHNIESLKVCMEAGIMPLPNIMIGFPEESYNSIRTTIEWMIKLGIYSKPHFVTPYPGSEWYYTYKESIMRQYHGDLEAYIKDLGNASDITAVISHRFSALELLGLQQLVLKRNLRLFDQSVQHGTQSHAGNQTNPLVTPGTSFNFARKKIKAPI